MYDYFVLQFRDENHLQYFIFLMDKIIFFPCQKVGIMTKKLMFLFFKRTGNYFFVFDKNFVHEKPFCFFANQTYGLQVVLHRLHQMPGRSTKFTCKVI